MWYIILNWYKDLCIISKLLLSHFFCDLKITSGLSWKQFFVLCICYLFASQLLWFLTNLEISYKQFHKHTFLVMMYFLSEIYLLFCIKTDSLWIIIIPIRNLENFIDDITQLCCSNWLQVPLLKKIIVNRFNGLSID